MNDVEKRIRDFLADERNIDSKSEYPYNRNGFTHRMLRRPFICTNGIAVSIQQGATHYVNGPEEVELWYGGHSAFLEPYGTGEDPYGYVPIPICALHIAVLEGRDPEPPTEERQNSS